MEAVPKKMV